MFSETPKLPRNFPRPESRLQCHTANPLIGLGYLCDDAAGATSLRMRNVVL